MRRRDAWLRGRGRIAYFLRARLHRRIFFWFMAAIFTSVLAVGLVMRVTGDVQRPPGFLALGVVIVVLWVVAGKVSRRLARPLVELSRVAEEIGAGRYAARAALHHHDGEVGVLGMAINDMAAKIERQMADQRELLAAVSHEIRTPLSRVRLLTEMARGGPLDARTLDEIDREVVEIDDLVGALLASSRLDFAALTPSVQGAADAARRALARAGKPEALLRDESEGATFEADATLVARALANLIDNADGHGRGLVALGVRRRDGLVIFEADDDGPGLPEGEAERLFEPFYRRAERSDQGSLGLGLSLVRRIAAAHGGTARAENRPGGGARVSIELAAPGALRARP